MQQLQSKLCEILKVSDIFNVPLLSPFEQLFHYLEEPDPEQWMKMAFIRSLLWYQMNKMQENDYKDEVTGDFEKYSSTALFSLFDNTSKYAVSKKITSQNDPLMVLGIIPLSAISSSDAESHILNIVFDTSLENVIEEGDFKDAWLALLQVYNIFQFLPKTGFTTLAGVEQGIYESIDFKFAQTGYVTEPGDDSKDVELDVLLSETFDEFEAGLRKIRGLNLPLPVACYELMDESSGEIIAEAELVWSEQRVVAMLSEQLEFLHTFTERGWDVIPLDTNDQWTDIVISKLTDFLQK
jgi:hypothetical protein